MVEEIGNLLVYSRWNFSLFGIFLKYKGSHDSNRMPINVNLFKRTKTPSHLNSTKVNRTLHCVGRFTFSESTLQ